MKCEPLSCSLNTYHLQPNADISGIGVLVGFIGTAYITFVLLIIRYAVSIFLDKYLSPIDRGILGWLSKKGRPSPSAEWALVLRNSILLMSDQQLVTSIAILVSGFTQFKCNISIYHWTVIVDLAWFSCVTHLSTLTYISTYLHEHKKVLHLRLPLMIALVVMLVVAILVVPDALIGHIGNLAASKFGVPARCKFLPPPYSFEEGQFASVVITQITLLFLLFSRVIQCYRWSRSLTKKWLREKPSIYCKRTVRLIGIYAYESVGWQQKFFLLLNILLLAALIMAKTIVDLIGSMLWDLLWLLLSLIWGTLRLYNNRWLVTRFLAEDQDYNDLEENSWEFGQLVPVLLLFMPLLNILDTVISMNSRRFVWSLLPTQADTMVYVDGTRHAVLREQSVPTDLPQFDLLDQNSQGEHLRSRTSPGRPRSINWPRQMINRLNRPGLLEVTTLYDDNIYHEPWFQDNIFITVLLFLLNASLILSLGNGQGAVRFLIDCAQSPFYWLQIPSLILFPLFYSVRRFIPIPLASGPVFILVNFVLGKSVKHRLGRLVYFSSVILPIWYFFFWKIQNQPFQNPSYYGVICYVILFALLYLPMTFLCIWVAFSSSALLRH